MACCAVAAFIIMKMMKVHGTMKAHTDKITSQLSREQGESCRIKITGITCPACVETIESSLSVMSGVKHVKISQFLSQALVEYSPKDILVGQIVNRIEELGFEADRMVETQDWAADIKKADDERERSTRDWKMALYGSSAMACTIVIIGLLPSSVDVFVSHRSRLMMEAILCGMLIAVFGRKIHHEAYLALQSARSDMSLLTSFGTILAFVGSLYELLRADETGTVQSSSFESTAILLCVVIGGRLLKSTAIRQSVSSLSSLASLMTETAQVLTGESQGDGLLTMAVEKVEVGDRVVVMPGDMIPIDGTILEGYGSVEETHVTGEILPILKVKGDTAFAGSVNHDGHLVIQVTRKSQLTWLQHTLQLMVDGDAKKAHVQGLADYLSARFSGLILTIALYTFFKTSWIDRDTWSKALYRTTAVLLCACPCALGLASPTAVMVGLGLASKRGLLIKGGSHAIEAAARVSTVLFDKTGTLTTGDLSVVEVQRAPQWDASEGQKLIWWSALLAAEQGSKHPIARAISQEARRNLDEFDENPPTTAVTFKNVLGQGVECELRLPCTLEARGELLHVRIGSRSFLDSPQMQGLPAVDDEVLQTTISSNTNQMESYISINNAYAGYICCADSIRPEAATMVRTLKARGYRVGMMTGGGSDIAHSVARAIGIHPSWVHANLLPKDKLRLITQIRSQHGPVAMVGDNLNDVQSMTAADFSLATFVDVNSLTAVTADALLLADNKGAGDKGLTGLEKVPYVLNLSRRIYGKIWTNVVCAIAYNLVAVSLAMGMLERFGVILSPVYAGLGMSLSSVFVLGNATDLEKETKHSI